MPALDQTVLHELIRTSYGGSDSTRSSSIRPQYVKYNALSKSRDFGLLDNLQVELSGELGAQTGAPTLFFRVQTRGPSKLGIAKDALNRYTDAYVSVGICDEDHNPLPLTEQGFAYQSAIHNEGLGLADDRLPAGTYFFTVSSSQWQSTPFAASIVVQRSVEISGVASGTLVPTLRLALVKLVGAADGAAPLIGTVIPRTQLGLLSGPAGGAAPLSLTLSIMRGVALGTLTPYGRLKQTWRIEGAASGTSSSVATMTVSRPYGYGY